MRLNYLKKNRLRMNNVPCPLSAYPLIETEMAKDGDTTYLPTANDIPVIFQNPDGELRSIEMSKFFHEMRKPH